MNDTLVLSPFYPTVLDLSGEYACQMHFGQPTRWYDAPEEFYEKVKQPGFEKFILSEAAIKKWASHSNFLPFIMWAMHAMGTDIMPIILGGTIVHEPLGESEAESVHVILYFPGHSGNTNHNHYENGDNL
jgi:hypothetical protein